MEERLQQVERDVSEMKTLAHEAISETRHATGALRELTTEVKHLVGHMAKAEERHSHQQAINDRVTKRLDIHEIDITALKVATGRSDVMTGALWSVWLKVGGAVAVAVTVGGIAAKATGVI